MSEIDEPIEMSDAFERRFATAISREAAQMDVLGDGLDQIHARLTRRRHRRQARWLAAAAVLIVIVGAAGAALRGSRDDSAPYVDSSDLPLLGFDDQPLAVNFYVPGGLYSVPDFARQSNGFVKSLTVWAEDIELQPEVPELDDTESITVAGQPATLGDIEVDGRPYTVVEWAPAPGSRAMLTVDTTVGPDVRASAREIAASVTPMDRASFEVALTEPSTQGDYPLPPLIPPGGTAGVHLLELRSGSRATLQLAGDDTGDSFVGLQVFAGEDRTGYSDMAIDRPAVRGTEGEVLEITTDAAPYRLLRWDADGRSYLLRFPATMATSDAVAIADGLRPPTPDEWASLLFPPKAIWPGLDWFMWLRGEASRPS